MVSKVVWGLSSKYNVLISVYGGGGGGGGVNLILPHPNFAFFGCPNEVK